MFCEVLGEDQDVIEVYGDNAFSDEIFEYLIHHCLEGSWAIGETEIHDEGFEQPSVCVECSFLFITFMDPDVVVAPVNVELYEVASTFEMVNEVVNERKWVSILPSDEIERAVALNEMELPIFLLDKEDRSIY